MRNGQMNFRRMKKERPNEDGDGGTDEKYK